MSVILGSLLLLAGSALMLIAALGAVRFPDLMLRMHAITKAGSAGVGLIGLAAAASFDDVSAITRALIMVLFVMITLPVAAHVIGRAAYFTGVPLWSETVRDELRAVHARRADRVAGERPGDDGRRA